MTTDHYAEAERLGKAHEEQLTLIKEQGMTVQAATVGLAASAQTIAMAQMHATLALTDAVRALKAGATVTTTFAECDREWTVLVDGEAVLSPQHRSDALSWLQWAREECEDPEPGIERGVLAWRPVLPVLPWTAEEAPRG